MTPRLSPLEALCALDAGGRGIAGLVVPGALERAARSLADARRVVLVTGFVPRPEWAAETDGPSGTVVLGRALRRLGVAVAYLADPPVLPLLQACLRVLGEPRDLLVVPGLTPAAAAAGERLVADFGPTHLVAIERPGRAADGGYYNARGRSISALNAPLDGLFVKRPRGVATIGVGDGGNEIGMGRVRARVLRDVPRGARIGSVVRTDHLVVAGTSNWGAWGLAASLGLLVGQDLLHTGDEERRLTRAMIAAGAVDGLTGKRQPTVDNLSPGLHRAFLETLRELTIHFIAGRRVPIPRAGEQETA
jgi:hypothetical protein